MNKHQLFVIRYLWDFSQWSSHTNARVCWHLSGWWRQFWWDPPNQWYQLCHVRPSTEQLGCPRKKLTGQLGLPHLVLHKDLINFRWNAHVSHQAHPTRRSHEVIHHPQQMTSIWQPFINHWWKVQRFWKQMLQPSSFFPEASWDFSCSTFITCSLDACLPLVCLKATIAAQSFASLILISWNLLASACSCAANASADESSIWSAIGTEGGSTMSSQTVKDVSLKLGFLLVMQASTSAQ